MFNKIINYQCPGYLSNLVPPLVSTTTPYHRRRPYERVLPAHENELYANSFIPSTLMSCWRGLTWCWFVLNCGTHYLKLYKWISLLRKYLSTNNTLVPIYYYFGFRKEQVNHRILQLVISNLNYDSFRRRMYMWI